MADVADIELEENTVKVLSTGNAPAVDIEGGNWNLAETDGDVRIGDSDNMLKLGVAVDGGGAGNGKLWATNDLRLGSRGESIATVDDGGIHPHDGRYILGRPDNRWHDAWLDGAVHIGADGTDLTIGNQRVLAAGDLRLGSRGDPLMRIRQPEGGSTSDGEVLPNDPDGNYRLGNETYRWWDAYFELARTQFLRVTESVTTDLIPSTGFSTDLSGGNFEGRDISLPDTQSLGSDDSRWGTVYATEVNAEVVNTPSDRRLKTDIEDLDDGLDTVGDLRPVSFSFRHNGNERHFGLIGQEVADVLPDLVTAEASDGTLGVNYSELIAFLIDAVQELEAENETLEDALDEQADRIADLEARITELERAVEAQGT